MDNTMSKFVPDALRKAAKIYEERNVLYGDNYKRFGKVMMAMFPNGVYNVPNRETEEQSAMRINRYAVLIQIISKLTRYCANFGEGGHSDSLDDLAVYAMMLQELDQEAKSKEDDLPEPKRSYCNSCEKFGVGHAGKCDNEGSLAR